MRKWKVCEFLLLRKTHPENKSLFCNFLETMETTLYFEKDICISNNYTFERESSLAEFYEFQLERVMLTPSCHVHDSFHQGKETVQIMSLLVMT